MTDFTQPRAQLALGTHHAGFTVTNVEPLPELGGCAYVFVHEASGARAMWLALPDNNKSFAIAFKTAPVNDTGVFHILEHSVLCGSERFPVKEPFVNLLKTSMQTFLNALTFPDKTMYPVASTNTADLENLMDVYLDAVLHPAIYQRPRIFEQEGWHLELTEDGGLVYNGVVFNEMKGALSDPDEVLYHNLSRQLFPNTAYGFESGGDPRAIPQLSYDEFIDTHARHYNLANSYTILYGDLDIDRELAFIDERFANASNRNVGAPNPLSIQAPVTPAAISVQMATAPENASVGLGYVIGTAADRERILATDILLDALCGSNESPLKRAVLDAGLADDFQANVIDSLLQPWVMFTLKGAKPEAAQKFRPLVEKICADLVSDGIERKRLEAALAQADFDLREGDWGSYGTGVALSMQSLCSWLYDDERPCDFLHYQEAIDRMRSGLDGGYFEKLLSSLIAESPHNAQVELVPSETGSADDEARELAAMKAAMSEDDLSRVADETQALRAEQEAPDAPEDLAKLPQLGIADIEDAPAETPLEHAQAPLPCLYHDLPTRRIAYAYHYFDLRCLAADELPYVGILTDLLGRLDTKRFSAAELDCEIEGKLGNLNFFCETYGNDDDLSIARPFVVVGASAISENTADLATLPAEVWGTTSFADTERIYAALQQRRVGMAHHFTNAGHTAAMARLATHYSSASVAADLMGGVDFYLFLKDLLVHWDERKNDLVARLDDLRKRIFTADEVTVSFVGSREDLERFWETGGTLGLAHNEDARAHQLDLGAPKQINEAFVIPAAVSFTAAGSLSSKGASDRIGAWQVAARAFSFDYLWNEVRVKGGAYGTGFRRATNGLGQFWSYRDPSIDATLERYYRASEWLAHWNGPAEELEGYIVSTVASYDSPEKPRQTARRQDGQFFGERPEGWRAQCRQQVLATTADQLRELAVPLAELGQDHTVCVFGPREAIEASGVDFEVRELMD